MAYKAASCDGIISSSVIVVLLGLHLAESETSIRFSVRLSFIVEISSLSAAPPYRVSNKAVFSLLQMPSLPTIQLRGAMTSFHWQTRGSEQ